MIKTCSLLFGLNDPSRYSTEELAGVGGTEHVHGYNMIEIIQTLVHTNYSISSNKPGHSVCGANNIEQLQL